MASLRQIRANVANAQHSTGPKTEEGKAISRRNALRHGLAGTILVLPEDDAEASRKRAAQLYSSLKPDSAWEIWLTERIGMLLVRIERCESQDAILRQFQADRAGTLWDEDRRRAAEELGALLPKSPALIARRLRSTSHGCDWLIERWEGLSRRLEAGPWGDDERRRAHDLLGLAADARLGPTPLDPAPGQDPAEAHRAVAAAQMARLRALKADALDEVDEFERLNVELGQEPEPDRARLLLRRYQRAAVRELQWCRSQFRNMMRPRRGDDSDPALWASAYPDVPAYVPPSASASASAPRPEPGAVACRGEGLDPAAREAESAPGDSSAEPPAPRARVDAPFDPPASSAPRKSRPLALGTPTEPPPLNRLARRAAASEARRRA